MQKYYTPSKLPFFAMAILTTLQDYLPFYLLSAETQNLPPLSKKPETPQEHPKKYNCPNGKFSNAQNLEYFFTHHPMWVVEMGESNLSIYIYLSTHHLHLILVKHQNDNCICVGAQFSLKCKALAKALCFFVP